MSPTHSKYGITLQICFVTHICNRLEFMYITAVAEDYMVLHVYLNVVDSTAVMVFYSGIGVHDGILNYVCMDLPSPLTNLMDV